MSNTPLSDKAIAQYLPYFQVKSRARLEVGAKEYGDISFERPIYELLEEIEQELLDQSNWAFIAFVRIQLMKEALTNNKDK